MTKNQFNKHKWKIGDVVYVITNKELCGFHFVNRVLKTTVLAIHRTVKETSADTSTSENIFLEVPATLEVCETCVDLYKYSGISCRDCDNIFTSEKDAERALARYIKKDNADGRAEYCNASIRSRLESEERKLNESKLAYAEFLEHFNLN